MKILGKIGAIRRLPFTNICPEKATNGTVWGCSGSFVRTDHKGCQGPAASFARKILRT